MSTSPAAPGDYPGRRLGLPADGRGSVAGVGARLLGLVIDWVVCLLVVALFVGGDVWTGRGWVQLAPLLVLFVEQTLLVGLLGTAIGHRVVRVQVVGPHRGQIGLPRAAVRALLLCLAVPPLLMDSDLRGLHDKAAGSVVVRSPQRNPAA
ncbi:MAG: RDD family protein [Actinomycetota bacterium]|nr:RDD family protein [Actinomycetota bacterium]